MKKNDLIKKLQDIKGNPTVVVTSNNFELNGATIPTSGIYEFVGQEEVQTFSDAFDGGSYNKKVVKYKDGGKTKFIQIS